jgi:protein arginine kinase
VPIVLRTRIRLARNLASVPFPGWSDERKRRQVLETCLKGLLRAPAMRDATALRLDDLSQLERQVLVERHLISRELMSAKGGAGVVISQDQGCSIMINEEDHLRIQMVGAGMDLQGLWARVNNVDSEIEDVLDYAFSAQLGYLTACPTNIGTGMRASAMMHLPGLVLAGHMDRVVRMVNQIGMAVRGLFGEGSDATGSIFQISNQQTLGESETDIIKRLESVLGAIMSRRRTRARS